MVVIVVYYNGFFVFIGICSYKLAALHKHNCCVYLRVGKSRHTVVLCRRILASITIKLSQRFLFCFLDQKGVAAMLEQQQKYIVTRVHLKVSGVCSVLFHLQSSDVIKQNQNTQNNNHVLYK